LSFNNEEIFRDFSFSCEKGEKIALTGKSGKGKTSLLNIIAGFIPDYEGEIEVCNEILGSTTFKSIRKKIAWLPQDTSLSSVSVEELLYTPFGFDANRKFKPGKKEVLSLFYDFHLSEEIFKKKVKEISGGQKQRIILISCLLLKKSLLILDEPTSALDDHIKRIVTDLIFKDKELTVIASTHDEYWINNSDKVIRL